jgi:hypothetical protein
VCHVCLESVAGLASVGQAVIATGGAALSAEDRDPGQVLAKEDAARVRAACASQELRLPDLLILPSLSLFDTPIIKETAEFARPRLWVKASSRNHKHHKPSLATSNLTEVSSSCPQNQSTMAHLARRWGLKAGETKAKRDLPITRAQQRSVSVQGTPPSHSPKCACKLSCWTSLPRSPSSSRKPALLAT